MSHNFCTHPAVLKVERVGSRVTCDPAPTDTDIDFLLYVDADLCGDFVNWLHANGFALGGSRLPDHANRVIPSDRFQAFKNRLNENLIVTMSGTFFDRFMVATKICKKLNLLKKEDRIAVFQAILYGRAT